MTSYLKIFGLHFIKCGKDVALENSVSLHSTNLSFSCKGVQVSINANAANETRKEELK